MEQHFTTMKNAIIASVIGAVIVFVYSAMSWMVLPFHADTLRYTPAEQEFMAAIGMHISESGVHGIPGKPPGATQEQEQQIMTANEGKPWMLITYYKAMSTEMTGSMITGFILNLLAVMIVVFILRTGAGAFASSSSRFVVTLLFGVFVILNSTLMSWNWWSMPWHFLQGELIDHLISWALCGVLLGWYLKAE